MFTNNFWSKQNLEKKVNMTLPLFKTYFQKHSFCVHQFSSWNKKCCKFNQNAFLLKTGCATMRSYVETCQCNDKYNVVHNVFIQISYCRKLTFMNIRQVQCHVLLSKVILILWHFTWHKWIMWNFCAGKSCIVYYICIYMT